MKLTEIKKSRLSLAFQFSKPSEGQTKTMRESYASQESLRELLPNFDKEANPDILAISFNSSVVNLVNTNDDGILTESAKVLAPTFKNKFINLEHERCEIIGCLLTQGYSSFASGDKLEDVANTSSEPFNIDLGGIIWKHAAPWFVEYLEDSTNPYSYLYQRYSASWEVGFDEYYIALGSKKLSDAELVTDDSRVLELSKYLRAEGGTGFMEDGTPVYRIIAGIPVGYGVAITTNPAANVLGITLEEKEKNSKKARASALAKENEEKNKNISTPEKTPVKTKRMKITDISDITEDTLKEAKASDFREGIRGLIKVEVDKKDLEIANKNAESKAKIEAIEKEAKEKSEKVGDLETKILSLSNELQSLKQEKESKAKQETFNSRLDEVKGAFNIDASVEKIITSKIEACASDEDFKKLKDEFDVLIPHLKKQSGQETSAEKLLAEAKKKEGQQEIPNSQRTQEPTALEKALASFANVNSPKVENKIFTF